MKRHRKVAYFCVTVSMATVGAVLFGFLGFVSDWSLAMLNGKQVNYAYTFMLGVCGSGLFALSVYVENPLVTVFNWLVKEGERQRMEQ